MVVLSRIILFVVAAAALPEHDAAMKPVRAVEKRAYVQVTNDLSALSTSVATLSSALAKYTGGGAGLLPINSAENAVESQIKKTTGDANSSPAVTAAQAQNVCNYFSAQLVPIIRSTLNALVAKKGPLVSAGAKGIIQGDLNSLSSESNALATGLIAKAPAAKKACASSASSTVIALFNSAKAQFT